MFLIYKYTNYSKTRLFSFDLYVFVATANTTREFSHKWKLVTRESKITQIDTDIAQTWATRIDNYNILTLENGAWTVVYGGLIHVSVGKSGVWGVSSSYHIFMRSGVASNTPYGTSWHHLSGGLKQIDAGSSGVVYGVSR